MAAKARQVAEIARQEMARLRVERKAMEEGTVRRLAEIEAERRSAERQERLRKEREEEEARRAEEEQRRRLDLEDRRKAGVQARREAEELAARRRAEMEARRAAEEQAERDRDLAVERQAKREEWTRRLRNVGNVAASVLILVIAISGAERLIGWAGPEGNAPTERVESPTDAAGSRTARETPSQGDAGSSAAESLAIAPPLIEVESLPIEEDVTAPPPITTPVPLDAFADSVSTSVERFAATRRRVGAGSGSCAELQKEFVAVDRAWMEYSLNGGTPEQLALDATRTERHRGLALAVRQVEVAFGASGCPRP